MLRILALLLTAHCLQAAAIRGVVLDHYTGHPLARTVVTLELIQGYVPGKTTVRTNSAGQFVFPSLRSGAYLLTAARPNYAVLKYGQKYWNAPGVPIMLPEDSAPFVELRLHRLAAITGTVWDENDVGIPDQEVYAYRATKPPTLVGHGKTDDRGAYRIGGLFPGEYLVRAGAKQLDEEASLTPTFYRESITVEDARAVALSLDEQAADANIHPVFGPLLRLSGRVVSIPNPCPAPFSATLISDMWSRTITTQQFAFDQLPRGAYEMVSVCGENPILSASYDRISVFGDTLRTIQQGRVPIVQLTIEDRDGKRIDPQLVSVFARRKDLAGVGITFQLKDGVPLLPARWELTATAAGNLYPVSITMPGPENRDPGRGDAWTEFLLTTGRGAAPIKVIVASGAAAVHGRVTKSLGESVVGAPVYLDAVDPISKQRLVDLRKMLTDTRGEYRFTGLVPGSYRIVSSFEFEDPDERMMESARAPIVATPPGGDAVQDLDLYVRP